MNIEEYQTEIHGYISAVPDFASVSVMIDDGTPGNASNRELMLRSVGLNIVVMPIDGGPIITEAQTGKMAYDCACRVVAEEDVKKNRSTTGSGVPIERATRLVLENVAGKPTGCQRPQMPFLADEAVFTIDDANGLRRSVITFKKRTYLQPI